MMTESLLLVTPTLDYADEIAAYRREFLENGEPLHGSGPLRRIADPAEWVQATELFTKPETLPEGYVIGTQFIYVRESDLRLVGMISVRHYLNDYLRQYAGHIGYSVRPSERRKGYGKAMLGAALPYCRKIGLERVLITCEENNEASRRTILANGGTYESTVFDPEDNENLERYWIEL